MGLAATIEKKNTDMPGTAGTGFGPSLTFVDPKKLAPLWQRVEKPGRYTGGEYGIPEKDIQAASVRVLTIYPDSYELGMSNQGLKILYDRVNRSEHFAADRFFLPMPDFAALLRQSGIPPYSLDHFLDIRSFDLWAINTATELTYTNILFALDLAGVPLERARRGNKDPIVITGGTAVSNPLPLFAFLDGIFFGDGEEAILEICEIIEEGKSRGFSRQAILEQLSSIEGLCLPHLYHIEDQGGTDWPVYSGPRIRKRDYRAPIFAALEHIVVPNIDIVQDRVVVEVARGCGQGCRFCHAGFWKRPVRNSQVDALVREAGRMLRHTGSNSVSLHSLSIADYPYLEELVVQMAQTYGPEGISLSLPSLRVQMKTIPVLEMTSGIRKSNITFALEAGTELQRERIRKKSSEKNLHYLIREVYKRGWDLVKVYLMMGLPDPDGTEIEGLISALNQLGQLAEESGPRKRVNVTVSLFVPKPFTTFQWERQMDPAYFREGLRRLKSEVKSRRLSLKGPNPEMPYVEGLLSRSDHRMGDWLIEAYRRGAVFDCWDDLFQKDLWLQLISEIPEGLRELWMGKKDGGSRLPWNDLVEPRGASLELLTKDYTKFAKINENNMNPPHPRELVESEFPPELLKPVEIPKEKFITKYILCLEYEKKGPAIYTSHLETVDILRKACRRVGLPVVFSEGFNKHERLHLYEPLPLFLASECESIYIELYDGIDLRATQAELNQKCPKGIRIVGLHYMEKLPRHKELNEAPRGFRLDFAAEKKAQGVYERLRSAPETFAFAKKIRKKKHRKKLRRGESDLRMVERRLAAALSGLSLEGKQIRFTLEAPATGAISIADLILHFLEIPVEDWNVEVFISKIRPML